MGEDHGEGLHSLSSRPSFFLPRPSEEMAVCPDGALRRSFMLFNRQHSLPPPKYPYNPPTHILEFGGITDDPADTEQWKHPVAYHSTTR